METVSACEVCGTRIAASASNASRKRFCSERCRERARGRRRERPERTCPVCLRAFRSSGHGVVHCSMACAMKAPSIGASCPLVVLACDQCGSLFVSRRRSKRCSDECQRMATNKAIRSAYHDQARPHRKAAADRARHRRRATMKRVASEDYHDADVYERDGWRCHICSRRIHRRFAWPHPMSKSIDHLVPVSQGGPDVLANVASAHLGCNQRRGVGGVAQLRLIA